MPVGIYMYVCICLSYIHVYLYIYLSTCICMGWLRLVGFLKLQVSFAEYHLFYRALLQKRPIILRSLLVVATPYGNARNPGTYTCICMNVYTSVYIYMYTYTYTADFWRFCAIRQCA